MDFQRKVSQGYLSTVDRYASHPHLSAGQQAAIVASAQDWATAQTVGKPKSGNVAGLDRIADRAAQSGASERTQRMADKVAKASPDLVPAMASACEDRLHG